MTTNKLILNLDSSLYHQINKLRGRRTWRQFFLDLIPDLHYSNSSNNSPLSFPFEIASAYAKIGLQVKRKSWDNIYRLYYDRKSDKKECYRFFKISNRGDVIYITDADTMSKDWVVM